MFGFPVKLCRVVWTIVAIEHAFKVKYGAVRKISQFRWNSKSLIFEQIKDSFRNSKGPTWKFLLELGGTGVFVAMQLPHMFPVLATPGTTERVEIVLHIFDVREVFLVQIEVQGASIVTVRAVY